MSSWTYDRSTAGGRHPARGRGGPLEPRTSTGRAAPAWADGPALGLVLAAALAYGGVNHYRLAHYYPLEWDLAIFAQGLHALARLETAFVTVRGMHLFGDHATFVHVLLAPLDPILGPILGPHLLPLVQTLALAASGLLLFGVARGGLRPPGARLVLAAYLLYPALQHTWLEYYEPVNLAVPCLIGAFAAVRARRDGRAVAWSLLALVTIENVALSVAALGVYAAARRRFRLGATLVVGASAYVALLVRAVFPAFEPGGYVYAGRLYGDFAADLPGAMLYLARPDHLAARLATPANGIYLAGLLVPVAFLPLLAPGILLLAVQLPLNMVSSWPYAREVRYHYVAPIVPFVFLALVRVLERAAAARRRSAPLAALVAGVLAGQLFFASPWLVPRTGERWWRGLAADAEERRDVSALLARISPGASVSAHYRFLPHLARRARLYMFPALGPGVPDAVLVDLDRVEADGRERAALARLGTSCREVGRTPRRTVLLSCSAGDGRSVTPARGEGSTSPPARR
ncbi:MAG TPA: DUF2079 domain-containing protein [Vicinamibacteria bacterium]|nr:DUF2079 domain-containing protein [Vicinamibacteria bacterium]